MSQIGTLTTGAGVTTVIAGQAQCESVLVLGSVGTANPLRGLQVEVDGTSYINIVDNATLLAAYSNWMMAFVSTVMGVCFKIATGQIPRSTTYRLTNDGATTPIVYAFSDNPNGIPFVVGTKGVNPSSNENFSKFSCLFLGTPANVSNAEVVFRSGLQATLSIVELNAMFALKVPATEAGGQFDGITLIDNRDQSIESVRINTNSNAGGCTVMIAKIPDAAFQMLKS